MTIPVPTPQVAVALASIAVHAREAAGPGGHPLDLAAINGVMQTPGVEEYLGELKAMALLPEPRS